ncbi:hypothetical protein FO519_006036 [Halicephalobus sp. NKZ332]|nr:hypothetical protein FO519_006036 [Halicephalobus sp. NKZ332]
MYISGFTLLLFLVINRVLSVIFENADLSDSYRDALNKTEKSTKTAKRLLESEGNEGAIEELRKQNKELKEQLAQAENDRDSMKAQAENLHIEYSRVCDELTHTAAELILKWFENEDKRTDGECQVMPMLHGQFFSYFSNNLEKNIRWTVYRDVFVFYNSNPVPKLEHDESELLARLKKLFEEKNEELKQMKKDRLEEATETDKNKLKEALDRLARKKRSKSNKPSESKTKSRIRSSKSKVRRRRIKDGDFEYEIEEDKSSKSSDTITNCTDK